MLGYKLEEVEDMCKTLNYSLHHHLPNVTGPSSKFVEEDMKVIRMAEELIMGLIAEGYFDV